MNMLCRQVESEKEREGSTVVAEDVTCVMETEMCTEGTYIPFDDFWVCSKNEIF